MFANLKNKLIEEVKASPSKFQQFANAAQAAVTSSSSTTPSSTDSNNTTTTNENFFSITEEDTPQNSPFKPQKLPIGASLRGRASTQSLNNGGTGASSGAIPRTRRLSNSSMASDVSFRLPSYDAPAVYHLQSDLDASGSEIEDSASTARLDVITKEQLYDAYKKSLDRYHKYRCRYTDLAKKYKDLERDSSKARSVLVETQEKAIRRISELREQCTLEQQAKAHLEEALRIEMDDMNCKMQAYQTKLTLLGENPEHVAVAVSTDEKSEEGETLIDLGDSAIENSSMTTNGVSQSSSIAKLQQIIAKLEHQIAERDKQLNELNTKCADANTTIEALRKQEEENVLLLAQTKQAIHTELEHKESEVLQLKEKLKKNENDLDAVNKKESQLVDSKEQLKKLQSAKHEADAKAIATEHLLNNLRTEFAAKEQQLTALESQMKAYKLESEESMKELRQHNAQLNEMVQRYQQNEVSLAEVDNELNRTKNDNDNLREELAESERRLRKLEEMLEAEIQTVKRLNDEVKNNEELKSKYEQQSQKIDRLEKELRQLSEQCENSESENVASLKAELEKVNLEHSTELTKVKTNVEQKEKELKAITNKLNKQKKQHEQQQNKLRESNTELENVKAELVDREHKLEKLKQVESEKNELQERVTSILQEITIMQEHMQEVQQSHSELETEKRSLESKIELMLQQQEDVNVDTERLRQLWQEWEQRAQIAETKLEDIVCENTKLLERNCLLEEQNNHIEKQLMERERQYATEEASVSDMRLKLQTHEDDLVKLNEKMKQVLDENSRMHNAQELMDHDYRTLQDKYDALEKEKLLAEDTLKAELESNLQAKVRLEAELEEIKQLEQITAKGLADIEIERENLKEQLSKLKAAQSDDQKHESLLEAAQQRNVELQSELNDIKTQLQTLEQSSEALERSKEELALLREQRDCLEEETKSQRLNIKELQDQVIQLENAGQEIESITAELALHKSEIVEKETTLRALQEQVAAHNAQNEEFVKSKEREELLKAELATLQNDHDCTRRELLELETVEQRLQKELETNKTEHSTQLAAFEEKCSNLDADVERLHESNDSLQLEIDNLKNKYEMQLNELQSALATREAQVQSNAEVTNKSASYDQMQIEIEYLNKHTKQLETELALAKEATQATNSDSVDLKDKLKSLQCELYVLQENAEQHAAQIKDKERLYDEMSAEMAKLNMSLDEKSVELSCQREHADFITQQNDSIQKELLLSQQQITEAKQQYQQLNTDFIHYKEQTEAKTQALEVQKETLHVENTRNSETIELLNKEVSEINEELQSKTNKIAELQVELAERGHIQKTSHEPQKSTHGADAEHLRAINDQLQHELEELKYKSSGENKHLQEEIDDLQTSNKQMAERILELEQLRTSLQAQNPQLNMALNSSKENTQSLESGNVDEKAELESKLKEIMNEVQDVTNRNLFLEQKCENFLILEQSNERLKLQNAKLSRQLDETLVSMQHSESISANTEFEYLKNIMFQYLTGNTNNETLVKVISAVLKFSPQQTQVALEKEHQRRSLLNKIL